MSDLRLAFVDEPFAWFCTDPADAWGDDWNDAPHDCNAGPPYSDRGGQWLKAAYDGDLEIAGTTNGGRWGYLSVEQINSGAAPWLFRMRYGQRAEGGHIPIDCEIYAGATVDEFVRLVAVAGGRVYFPKEAA